jgi:diguanylate cyclase (GGDEF)-like protein
MATRKTEEPASDAAIGTSKSTAGPAVSLSALKEQAAGLRRAQLLAGLAHVITRPDGSFESWSETLPMLLRLEERQIVTSTRRWLDLVHPRDRALFRDTALAARARGARAEVDYRLLRSDGTWIHVRQVMEPIPGQANRDGHMRWFNTLQDVSAHKNAEDRIKRLNRVYAVLSGINSLIVRAPKRKELFQEACRIAVDAGELSMAWLGLYDPDAKSVSPVAWHGKEDGFLRLLSLSMPDPVREGRGLVRRAIREKRPVVVNDIEHDTVFRLRDEALGRGYRSAAVLPLIVGGNLIGVISFFAGEPGFFDDDEMRLLIELAGDISFAVDHIDKAEKLDYLNFYDGLTGLSNRMLFLEHLGQYIKRTGESQTKLAVIVSDVERFRAVNDTLGRQAGDVLLTQFAERLAGTVADKQQLSRIGGDLFAVALPVKDGVEAARQMADMAKRCFAEPFRINDSELRISAKAGVALFPDDGADAETLFSNAEAALKRCKKTGERVVFFEERMTERVAANLNLENQLRRAIERDEFVLHYQPRVDFEARRVLGLEALIRWQSEGRLVPPGQFIPLLEETGLILQVGAWALREAVRQHRSWLDQGIAAPRIAVNVSTVQLRQKDFVARVKRAIEQGASPTGIDLEITESMIMDDIAGNIGKLRAVRDLGVSIAIDDFGTGYSSLAYLAKLPVASLKIDRSFVITMLADPNTMTLVSTVISLGHALKLKVVAEGVDSEDQASMLRLLRCDEMQGYLFSKPLPAAQVIALFGDPPKSND